MNIFKNKKEKGFTLIELLVVVSIISFLSSVVLASVRTVREKAITAKITEDLRQVKIAVELGYGGINKYEFSVNDANTNFLVNNIYTQEHTFSLIKKVHAQGLVTVPEACNLFNQIATELVSKKLLNSVPVHPKQNYGEGICYKAIISADETALAMYAETPARIDLTVSYPTKKVGFVTGNTSISNLNDIRTKSIQQGGGTGYLQIASGSSVTSTSEVIDEIIGVTKGSPAVYIASSPVSSPAPTSPGVPTLQLGPGTPLPPGGFNTSTINNLLNPTYGPCTSGGILLANGVCEVTSSGCKSGDMGPCIYYSTPQYWCPTGQRFLTNGLQNTINGTCAIF